MLVPGTNGTTEEVLWAEEAGLFLKTQFTM